LYGFVDVQEKMQLLAFYCRDGRSWFVKDGWANFTIETLSNRWNNLLPQQRLTPEEQKNINYKKEAEKWEAHDEAVNKALGRAGTPSGGNGTGTAIHAPR
ncbi:MAG TPA: hypothetical protein VIJ14_03175, partial [Rhabdochlamydiaceae bacterium]